MLRIYILFSVQRTVLKVFAIGVFLQLPEMVLWIVKEDAEISPGLELQSIAAFQTKQSIILRIFSRIESFHMSISCVSLLAFIKNKKPIWSGFQTADYCQQRGNDKLRKKKKIQIVLHEDSLCSEAELGAWSVRCCP